MSSKYNMDHKKRGTALVINIKNFENNAHNERMWSDSDVKRLKETLNYLEFDLKLNENLTKQQIEEKIRAQANISHDDSDCFLCVIMSHGNAEKIVASDNKEISFEEIMKPIKSSPSLKNKPKMFFFQACRGESQIEQSLKLDQSRTNSASSIKSSHCGEMMTDHMENIIPQKVKTQRPHTKIETESDLLVYYSTLPNHLSYSNNVADGTIFIKSLCDVLNDAYKNLPHKNLSLAQMITQINQGVLMEEKQIADPIFRMSKEVYFHPKNILHDEWIAYLKRENKSNYELTEKYYMPRRLKRFIQIDRKILDIGKDGKTKKKFLIVHSEDDFRKKCKHLKEESIHYLKLESENANLLWQKSKGPISDLNEYLVKDDAFCFSILEDQILNHNEFILIISAEPGMGKSTILDKLNKCSNSKQFYLKIILNTCTEVLKSVDLKVYKEDLMDFIFKSLLMKKDDKEISLLKYLAKEEKLILMFDGVDEVSECKEQVIHLIESIISNNFYKLKKILITTRNHFRAELEDSFKTIAFNLNKFDEEDQKSFLFRYWRSFNQNLTDTKLINTSCDLIKKLNASLTQNINQLIGIPLQTKMLGDIFLNELNSGSHDDFSKIKIENISDLYHTFIEKKIHVQFEEKNKINIKLNIRLYEREKKLFYSDHVKLSSKVILRNTTPVNLDLTHDEILEYGLIVNFLNETPTFLHQSFAEYFVAKYALDKIESDDVKEIDEILRDDGNFLIRRFLNDLMKNREKRNLKKHTTKESLLKEIKNCCKENLYYILEYLLEIKEESVKTTLKSRNDFILTASENGHNVIIEFLMKIGIKMSQIDEKGRDALHLASLNGHKEMVEFLLNNGFNITKRDDFGDDALDLASAYGRKEVVLFLLEKGIQHNKNALHEASRHGHKDIVELLIQKGFDVNKKGANGQSPLHLASENGHKEIVEFLLKQKGIEINHRDCEGQNALHLALKNYTSNAVLQLLVQNGIDIYQCDNYGHSVLHQALFYGHKNFVEMLIINGFDINQKDKWGRNALHIASLAGYKDIVEFLLMQNEMNFNEKDSEGNSVLQIAARYGKKEIVQLYLEKGIDINQTDHTYGRDALLWASRAGHKEIAELLLKQGADLNKKDKEGNNSLYLAFQENHKEVVHVLLQNGSDINQLIDGKNLFNLASEKGFTKIVNFLIKKGINITQVDTNGRNALHLASMNGREEIVQILIQNGIDTTQVDTIGRNALHFASNEGHLKVVELLLEKKSIDINQTDNHGKNSLHLVASYENWSLKKNQKALVELLISRGIDVNKLDNEGNSALNLAYKNNHKEIVKLLIEKGVDVNQTDKNGENVLHWASLKGHTDIVTLLIEKGIDVNRKNKSGYNALLVALTQINEWTDTRNDDHCYHMKIIKLLLKNGIDINEKEYQGANALHLASAIGQKENVKFLIENGIKINQTTNHGKNALYLASEFSHKEIAEILIQKEIDVNQSDKDGDNALLISSLKGHKEIVELLLRQKQIDINHQNKNGQSALDYAILEGHKEIIEILQKGGSKSKN